MNLVEARTALRWALGNPATAGEAGEKLWKQLDEAIPKFVAAAGAYALASWATRKLGLPDLGLERPELPRLELGGALHPAIVEKTSGADGSDPVEDLRTRDERSILRARLEAREAAQRRTRREIP